MEEVEDRGSAKGRRIPEWVLFVLFRTNHVIVTVVHIHDE